MPRTRSARQVGRPPGTDSAETEARILEAAREVFAVHGYAGTTIRKVADRAGVAAPTLYHYFTSKQQLFLDVFLYTRRVIGSTMLNAARADTPLVQQMEDMLRAALALHEQDWSFARFEESATIDLERYPELREAEAAAEIFGAGSLAERFQQFFQERLAEARRRGEVRAPVSDATVLALFRILAVGLARLAAATDDLEALSETLDGIAHLLRGTLFESQETLPASPDPASDGPSANNVVG